MTMEMVCDEEQIGYYPVNVSIQAINVRKNRISCSNQILYLLLHAVWKCACSLDTKKKRKDRPLTIQDWGIKSLCCRLLVRRTEFSLLVLHKHERL